MNKYIGFFYITIIYLFFSIVVILISIGEFFVSTLGELKDLYSLYVVDLKRIKHEKHV